ncbi:helix-turn-helix domain-containing protein [Microbacterium luticocti]|uniref:helix-turn-helix domain-containing protein n=1 Tax=Microbacterium luticocti TaxID=451764 RepID=UPI000421FF76|nr:helix-turn-helix domain-containing protein [Microbacterium luticocti]
MRELAGRLLALDPEASETLKVIAYFDRLIDGRVGAEGMLRGAATLAGAPVGHARPGAERGRRFGPDAASLPDGSPDGWPSVGFGEGAVVWLERSGEAHANDAMVLERLAIALSILSTRLDTVAPTRQAVETLVSADATDEQRDEALQRLALPVHVPVHAVAVPTGVPLATAAPHAVVATRFGVVRAVLTVVDATGLAPSAGIGVAAHVAGEIPQSWRSALIALRLADPSRPVVRADELGALLALFEVEDQRAVPHPDVDAVGRALAAHWTESLLRGLSAGASHRALAAEAGVHHSTMGARVRELTPMLGFDPATPVGRTRLDVALMLYRLANTRFDGER